MANFTPGSVCRQWVRAAAILLPIILFAFFTAVHLPFPIPLWLVNFNLIYFCILVAAMALAFHLPDDWSWLISGTLAAFLFALPLAYHWNQGTSNANIIAGFIPYKDGFYYYNGAQMLLAGRPIGADGLQGAFRPLLPGLMSVMLLITNHNLMIGLAVRTILLAFSCLLAAMAIRSRYGTLPAALFFGLLVAFIRPLVSYSLTEIPSLAFSCLSLILLFEAVDRKSIIDGVLGSLMLVIAISVRAGPFFMLPMLALCVGWVFRKENRFNLWAAGGFLLLVAVEFAAANLVFPRLVTSGGSSTFGNFSWMLYGQAVGGAGWDYHYQVLGTHDGGIVMQAALERLRAYPQGLLIGSLKAYRDFFLPGQTGIFHLITNRNAIQYQMFWWFQIGLMALGLVFAFHRYKDSQNAFLLACFAGIFLSIPFLPPIDGGNRFYSGCMPFLFALQAFGLAQLVGIIRKKPMRAYASSVSRIIWVRAISGVMAAAILIAPVVILQLRKAPEIQQVSCPSGQLPVAFQIHPGSFADILPDSEQCRGLPTLCLSDFEANGVDKRTDDFFRKLVSLAVGSLAGIRIAATVNLVSDQYGFVVIPLEWIHSGVGTGLLQGCAEELETEFQRIFFISRLD